MRPDCNSINASHLSTSVAQTIPATATITLSNNGTHSVNATIAFKDIKDGSYGSAISVTWWLADSMYGGVNNFIGSIMASSGVMVYSANTPLPNGIAHSGSGANVVINLSNVISDWTGYLHVSVAGIVYVSALIDCKGPLI